MEIIKYSKYSKLSLWDVLTQCFSPLIIRSDQIFCVLKIKTFKMILLQTEKHTHVVDFLQLTIYPNPKGADFLAPGTFEI